jgi:hypothetical protein
LKTALGLTNTLETRWRNRLLKRFEMVFDEFVLERGAPDGAGSAPPPLKQEASIEEMLIPA